MCLGAKSYLQLKLKIPNETYHIRYINSFLVSVRVV